MINLIIHDAICKLEELQGNENIGNEFRDIPPVLWFGNIDSDTPKMLVVSTNPNRPDLPEDNPRIPYCKEWVKKERDIEALAKDYNNYFFNNPSTNWFGKDPKNEKEEVQQGRIEDFLNGLDASFYGEANYQAIHIDLLPFSTKTTFTKIDTKIMAIKGLSQWINKHLQEMIDIIKPEAIIVNGSTNFDYFNLCINLGAQPYQAYKFNKSTIWISTRQPNIPPIIGISTNMGSYCLYKRHELLEMGRQVKEFIQL